MKAVISLVLALTFLCCSGVKAKTLFYDDFEDGVISGKWTLTGDWEEKEGHLASVGSKFQFNYAVPSIPEEFHSKQITIQAKGMIVDLPWTRMGVAARLTEHNLGHLGYVLATPENGPNDLKLLNEGVRWINLNTPLRPQLEEWVWVQLTITESEELIAKVWRDGEDEPNKENGSSKEGGRPSGVVALVGKAIENDGRGGAIPMYDEVEVWDKGGPSEIKIAVSSGGKLATAWASIKKR